MWYLLRGPEKHQTIPERLDVTFHLVKPQEVLSDSSDEDEHLCTGDSGSMLKTLLNQSTVPYKAVILPDSSALWARKSANSRHLSGSSRDAMQ